MTSKHKSRNKFHPVKSKISTVPHVKTTHSFLEKMQDGLEYSSIVDLVPADPTYNLFDELKIAFGEIEKIRNRPCIAYIGNVVRKDNGLSGVDDSDDVPFAEMIESIAKNHKSVDIFLTTRGGSGYQIGRFVNCLRSRFDEVDFIIPSFCMSAGTLFAMSGNHIWMTDRACLGPVDPQVPTKDGRYVPAQALLLLVKQIQQDGDASLKKTGSVPWTSVRIIDTIDKKELGDAVTASEYSRKMVAGFLENYKFRDWTVTETRGLQVTPEMRRTRALEIADALASHDRWLNHGHAISRDVLWQEIQLKIDHPDQVFERAIRRAWAMCNWIFDKSTVLKIMLTQNLSYVRMEQKTGG